MPELHEIYDAAEMLKDEGKFEEAVERYQEILKDDPDYVLAHFALAVVYGKLGDHAKAVEHGERAAQLEPNEPFSFTALSVTYHRAFESTRDMKFVQLAEQAKEKAHQIGAGPHH